jgi:hypothetical protein
MTTEKIRRIKYLRDECDHLFMSYTFVTEINALFGTRLDVCYSHEFGGFGRDASEIAEGICVALHVPYDLKIGRGTALRECCDKLLAHFGDEREDVPLN